MSLHILKRLFSMLPALFGVTVVVFLMVHLTPGDPARLILGKRATPEAIERVRRELGLDEPIHVQYLRYLERLITGDLGYSIKTHRKVVDELRTYFPATLELSLAAMIFAVTVGMGLGILAAVKRGGIFDLFSMVAALMGVSIPIFWLGLMLILVFSHKLGLLPVSGRIDPRITLVRFTDSDFINGFFILRSIATGNFRALSSCISHLALPAITLGTVPMAVIARMTRSSLLEVLNEEYIRTAYAKGLGATVVIFKHALRNAIIPVITVIGLEFGYLMGGAILTETVFAWPGVGRWLWQAVSARDFPAIQGGVLFIAIIFMLVNLTVDLCYTWVDPRMRSEMRW
jgi:peptide/nickel transport system permease protein